MSTRAKVTCPKCQGRGRVSLSPEMESTLSMVLKNGSSSAEIAAELLITTEAASNRLERLRKMGAVRRGKKEGRVVLYFKK